MLEYLGVEYEEKLYNFGPPPDYSRDEWLSAKPTLGLEFVNVMTTVEHMTFISSATNNNIEAVFLRSFLT